MAKNIQGAIYADDLALWCSEECITPANYRRQQALQVIETGARSWFVKVNEKKKTSTIFSLTNQHLKVCLKLNGASTPSGGHTYTPWRHPRSKTYLKNQLHKEQARANFRSALMKKLSCTVWRRSERAEKAL